MTEIFVPAQPSSMQSPEDFAREWYDGNPVVAPLLALIWYGTPEEEARARAAFKALGLAPLAELDAEMDRAKTRRRLRLFADGVPGASRALDAYDVGDFSDCVTTGLTKLDRRHAGGLTGGRMYLFGAPSGSGKTTLLQIITAAASESGPVLFVSPEMTLESLIEREVVRASRIPVWDRNPWKFEVAEKEAARQAHSLAFARILREKRQIYVLDQSDATMTEIERAAEAIKGLQLVVIDYAQQVAGDADERNPRYLQVGAVATRSVALAKKLNIPVVVASQVNTSDDKEKGRRYTFRESAVLDQKAHASHILHVTWNDDENTEIRTVKEAWIWCTKNRSGPGFKLRVNFQPDIYHISDWEAPAYQTWSPYDAQRALPSVVPGD